MKSFLMSEKEKIKSIPAECGVYALTNLITGRKYYGSSGNLRRRIGEWKIVFIKLDEKRGPLYGVSKRIRQDGEKTSLNNWKGEIVALIPERWKAEKIENDLIRKGLKSNSDKIYNERISWYFQKEVQV